MVLSDSLTEGFIMARSTSKTILFSRVTVDGKPYQWPTAVFNDLDTCKAFATAIGMAHKSGDVETAKALDASTVVDKNGKLVPGLKFSIKEVPYAPSVALGASAFFDDDEKPTE